MTNHACRRRYRSTAVLLITLIGLPSVAAGTQSRPAKDPTPNPYPSGWEQWREAVPVSGGLRVGVMAESGPIFNPAQMTVWLPKTDAPALCVELSSQDGSYVGSVKYDIRGDPPGPLLLNLPPSQHRPKLQKLGPAQLAILARLAKSCGSAPEGPGDFVIAAWNQQQLGSKVLVLLNSRLPTSIVGGEGVKVQGEYPCQSLSGTTTAFNLQCTIPLADVGPAWQYSIRMRRGSSVNTVPLPLAIPR